MTSASTPADERAGQLRHHHRDPDRRVDPPQLAVADARLADRHLGHVEHRHGRVADQLLADQARDRDQRQPRRRERDQQVAQRGEQQRHDDDAARARSARRPARRAAPRAASRSRRAPRPRRSRPGRGAGRRSRTAATSRRTRPTSPPGPSSPRRGRAGPGRGRRAAGPRGSRAMTGSRSDAGGGGGSGRRIVPSSTAETTNERASMAIAIGAVSRLTRNPAMPNAGELDRRARRGQRAVGAHEVLAADDRREVCAVGDVEERRQHGGQRRHDEHLRERQPAADRRDRDAAQQHAPDRGRPRSARAAVAGGRPRRRPRTRPAAPRRGPGCAAPRPRSARRGASGWPRTAARSG